MKTIITGVAGFIGSNLAAELLKNGHQVIGLDNFSFGNMGNIAPILNNPNFELFNVDVRNKTVFDNIKGDVLIHLASQKIPRYSNALATLDDNSNMLKNVVEKCITDKIKLVFASTSDVYGKNTNVPFHEESDLVMGPTTVKRWAYALSKMYAEQYIIANNEEYGLEYTIVRFFGSYGPNQNLTWWGGPQSVFIGKALMNDNIEIHGDGKQTRTFTYIKDTVQGILKAIFHENSKNDIFNIAGEPNNEITILDLGSLIWKLIHGENSEPKIKFIPYETFGKYEDVMRRVPDISKIKEKLNFKPEFDLKIGLIDTIKWQKTIKELTV
jgi:UDP-glucose 4-epimerase